MDILSFVIIKENNRFLLIQEANEKWKNKWFLPGGKMEEDEDISSCAIRETQEEAGFIIDIDGIFFMEYYNGGLKRKKIHFYLVGKIKGGKLKTFTDEHSKQAKWVGFDESKP